MIIKRKIERTSLPVLNPLVVNISAGARKLPAALLTRMSSLPNLESANLTAFSASSEDRTSPCIMSTYANESIKCLLYEIFTNSLGE